MKTLIFKGVHGGDWVRCCDCGAQMLLPSGADRCPVCGGEGCLQWVNENMKEVEDEFWLPEIERTNRELKPQDYLEVETLEQEYPDLYKELMDMAVGHTDFYYVLKHIHQIEYEELRKTLLAHGGSWSSVVTTMLTTSSWSPTVQSSLCLERRLPQTHSTRLSTRYGSTKADGCASTLRTTTAAVPWISTGMTCSQATCLISRQRYRLSRV